MVGQALLIALLDLRPLCLEFFLVNEFQEAFEFRKVFQPDTLFDLEGSRNESAQSGVALMD